MNITRKEFLASAPLTAIGAIKRQTQPSLTFGEISYSGNASNLAYVGNYGAKENDPTVDWQAVVNTIAKHSTCLDFGSGSWAVSSPIDIPETINIVSGSGAVLSAADKADYILCIFAKPAHIYGITFNGNGKTHVLLKGANSNNLSVSSCMFMNVNQGNYGIYCERDMSTNPPKKGLGLQLSSSIFINSGGKRGGCAVKTHTDSVITACKFFQFDYSIACQGASVSSCYFWSNSTVKGAAIVPEAFPEDNLSPGTFSDLLVLGCEFDCMRIIVINPANAVITNNLFYWNATDIDEDCYLFCANSENNNSFRAITFSLNIIKTQRLKHSVKTFGYCSLFKGEKNLILENYHSENNQYALSYTNEKCPANYVLTIGTNSSTSLRLTPSDRKDFIHIVEFGGESSKLEPILSLTGAMGWWKYDRYGSTHRLSRGLFSSELPAFSVRGWHKAGDLSSLDTYLDISPLDISAIDIVVSKAFNITLVTGEPDISGFDEI